MLIRTQINMVAERQGRQARAIQLQKGEFNNHLDCSVTMRNCLDTRPKQRHRRLALRIHWADSEGNHSPSELERGVAISQMAHSGHSNRQQECPLSLHAAKSEAQVP